MNETALALRETLGHLVYFNFVNIEHIQQDECETHITSTDMWKRLLELAGINNIRWREDDCGEFWTADLIDEDGYRIGLTGNYYDVDENNKRASPKLN